MKTVSLPSPHPPTLLDNARLNLEEKRKRERRNMLDEGLERGSGTWSGFHRSIWDSFFYPPLIKVSSDQMLKKLYQTKISISVC